MEKEVVFILVFAVALIVTLITCVIAIDRASHFEFLAQISDTYVNEHKYLRLKYRWQVVLLAAVTLFIVTLVSSFVYLV